MVVATERLGYAKLSAEQDEAVLHFLSGWDVFVSLTTGARKSLCYHILPTRFDLLHGCSTGSTSILTVVASHHNIAMIYIYIALGYELAHVFTRNCAALYMNLIVID